MLALTDDQLQSIMTVAGGLPVEKRSVSLERVAARLQLHGAHFTDADPDDAVRRALCGLIQNSAGWRRAARTMKQFGVTSAVRAA